MSTYTQTITDNLTGMLNREVKPRLTTIAAESSRLSKLIREHTEDGSAAREQLERDLKLVDRRSDLLFSEIEELPYYLARLDTTLRTVRPGAPTAAQVQEAFELTVEYRASDLMTAADTLCLDTTTSNDVMALELPTRRALCDTAATIYSNAKDIRDRSRSIPTRATE